ncbi:MAG: HEAT repeat domain-containing protein [Candidatus Zipacnadales bacterium]
MEHRIAGTLIRLRRVACTRLLYPPDHPMHKAATTQARQALADLFRSHDRIDLAFSADEVIYEGKPLPDPDGSLREIARHWWDQGICRLTIFSGLTPDELDILLDANAPSHLTEFSITRRLKEGHVKHLVAVEVDYGRFVPLGELQTAETRADDAGQHLLRQLVVASPVPDHDLTSTERLQLLSLLDDPSALAQALHAGVLLREGLPELVEASAEVIDFPVERLANPSAAAAAIVQSLQQLAELACEQYPDRRTEVFARLAEALRHLHPQLRTLVFRAEMTAHKAGFDVLTEAAKHFTIQEIVELVGTSPQSIAAESSSVYRRLLQRLASTSERRRELQEALLAFGIPETLFSNTFGMLMEEMQREDTASSESMDVAGRLERAQEKIRAARRVQIEPQLKQIFAPEAWSARALTILELLALDHPPQDYHHLLTDLQTALHRMPLSTKKRLGPQLAVGLTQLLAPGSSLPVEHHGVVRTLLVEITDSSLVETIREALDILDGPQRIYTLSALVLSGQAGQTTLFDLLAAPDSVLQEHDVPAIVDALVDATTQGIDVEIQLIVTLLHPACAKAAPIVQALAKRGGSTATRWLHLAFQRGTTPLRRLVIEAVGTRPSTYLGLLLLALNDRSVDIAASAATFLGDTLDPQAGEALLRLIRPFRCWGPRFSVRLAAIHALGKLRHQNATSALTEVLNHVTWFGRMRNDQLRSAAAKALGQIATPASLAALASRASIDRNPYIREQGAWAAQSLAATKKEGNIDAA